ncbi:hypothetical protein HLB44_36640 [Aquincola sp. S2]|uniref:DUF3224 domain-containing protein n=1 Tax=Pseudaquabacterium terrae TaxID=2732868 RepID=A0ABX2EV70_9BURK|nr:hypothetical protein [Aquabacterium terrae]NRF72488.1 hypothetical protein [Aquabacterium terrae]
MHHFLEHISADEYWFDGVIRDSTAPFDRPFVVTGTFLNDNGQLLFEGTYRFTQTDVSRPLMLQVLSTSYQAAVVILQSSHTGKIRGTWHFRDNSSEILASGPTGSAASGHVELIAGAGLRVSGAIQCSDASFGFTATGSPGSERSSLSNVVSVSGGKRVLRSS